MTKAVFTASVQSDYEDLREHWYHFPNRYLGQVRQAVGDLVIFYEPRRDKGPKGSNGSQCYVAMARVIGIRQDTNSVNHHFADLSEYIAFDYRVPFKSGQHYYESALRKQDGTTNRGSFGWSVRLLADEEFEDIFQAGFAKTIFDSRPLEGDERVEPNDITERKVSRVEINRRIRDAAFRRQVKDAYDNTCALTGLSIIGPTGLAEVQAAHIRSVASNGPDTISNGIALTGTMHWLFDKGLVSIDDNFRILVADRAIPADVTNRLAILDRLKLPTDRSHSPSRCYLNWHRTEVFIG